ncbi:MAG: hydroxymethylbilane synthase [Bacteroidota bacterium]|jgi:hydroxymethylbilane synthase
MTAAKIIIGTRGSELALWQANFTKKLLEKNGHTVEIKIISTAGDRSQQWNTAWDKMEGKGFFTKELEEALLSKEIDLAVHSYKDLPTEEVKGLTIAGVSKREDPSEILIIRKEKVDEKQKFRLKSDAIVGTSSARRKSQLLAFRPDIKLKDLRGNVPTRVNKLRSGEYDAIMIALAGVSRLNLNLDDLHTEIISTDEIVPAPAQGVLAWQTRENDYDLIRAIEKINDEEVQYLCSLEKKVLSLFDGGCQLPLGILCEKDIDEENKNIWRFTVSKANSWDNQPLQLKMETHHPYDFPDKIVAHLNQIKSKKIFITKNFREKDYLPNALKKIGFIAQGISLIEFRQISLKDFPIPDWIFFSSKHAIKYFFQQKPAIGNAKIGCVGKATAQELRNFGMKADFIGQSTDTRMIGKQFASLAGKSKVLFPMAKESLQSVQNQLLNKEQAFNLPVYATLKNSIKISEDFDIVVFTSPSNVDAFFEKNTWRQNYKAVAMGDATGKALLRKGIKKYAMPDRFDDLGLYRAILSISN